MGVDPDLVVPVAITIGVLVIALAVCIPLALRRRGALGRARAAAIEALGPFAQRFGVALAAGGSSGLPWLRLAGPGGRIVTICAELVSGDAPMNDEPHPWVRKILAGIGYTLLGILYVLYVLALMAAPNNSTSYTSNTSSVYQGTSGSVRRTTLLVPLAAYFAPMVVKAKHGFFRRLFVGSSIRTGDGTFDATFWIKGPPDHARAVLTPPVRAALLAFRAEHGRFGIEQGRLAWSRRSYSTEGLDRVLDGISRLTATLG
jgi:hypothetical protein